MPQIINFLLIILVSLASIVGNSFFRAGLRKTGIESLNPAYLFKNIFNVIFQPYVIMGILVFGAGAIIWFHVLSHESLNHSYPVFIGFSALFLVLSSNFFLKESITLYNIIGMFLIFVGTYIAFLKV